MEATLKITVHVTRNVNEPILLKDNSSTTLSKMFLAKHINHEGYIHITSMQFGELNLLYNNKQSAHIIEWTYKAVVKIKACLTPDAHKLVFATTAEGTRPQRYDINSNRLRSYSAAVNRQYGNPQDNNLPQTQETVPMPNPNDGDTPEPQKPEPKPNPLTQEQQEHLEKLQSQIDTMSTQVE